MDTLVLTDQQQLKLISSVWTPDTISRTYQEHCTDAERKSREYMLLAHFDNDEIAWLRQKEEGE